SQRSFWELTVVVTENTRCFALLIYESFVKVAVILNQFFFMLLLGKPLCHVRHSNPMLSDSSIRRHPRQRNISQRCRNQHAGFPPMSAARLTLRGRHRFPIGLSFLKHPEACLREVARQGHFGLAVATPGLDALVEPADVTVPTALRVKQRTIGR